MRFESSSELRFVEAAMQRQQLRSEHGRVRVFVCLLGLLLLVPQLLPHMPSLIEAELRPRFAALALPLTVLIGVFLVYEVLVLRWLGRLLAAERLPPSGFAYANTVVELSMPTAALLVGSSFLGGINMLASAIPSVYFLFLGLAALSLNPRLCLFAGLVASAQFLVVSLFLLQREPHHADHELPVMAMIHSPHQWVIKSVFLVLSGVITAFVARQIRRQLRTGLQTLEERDRAVSIFGQHVSPQVAELLLKQPLDATGQERRVCVMFLDIRDFSQMASERSPAEVMDYLNTIFARLLPVINAHHGIVNKFLGDGFMAVFGAPLEGGNASSNAVNAAWVILEEVEKMNQEGRVPATRIGMGLHFGAAITGNVGGGDRKEYTVIGDVVNLAARIEQATKTCQAQLLVSESVHGALPQPVGEDVGLVELKGQPKPIRLFKLA